MSSPPIHLVPEKQLAPTEGMFEFMTMLALAYTIKGFFQKQPSARLSTCLLAETQASNRVHHVAVIDCAIAKGY